MALHYHFHIVGIFTFHFSAHHIVCPAFLYLQNTHLYIIHFLVFSYYPRKLQSWGWLWKQFHLQNLSCKYYLKSSSLITSESACISCSCGSNIIPFFNHQIFQFQFVNSFLALFYTAFYLQDIEKLMVLFYNIYKFLLNQG